MEPESCMKDFQDRFFSFFQELKVANLDTKRIQEWNVSISSRGFLEVCEKLEGRK